jgi:hypothetical protein
MKTIKIDFLDFWPDFKKENNFFINLLKQHYNVVISDRPDYIIYSVYGRNHLHFDGVKIFYTGESYKPDYKFCDFSLSFEYEENERNLRLPLYVLYGDMNWLIAPKPPIEETLKQKTGFCNMVVSNASATKRIEFFEKLSKYKKVDSGGRHLNNIGGPIPNKKEFIKNYKFTLAFENTIYPGYTTEKLVEPMFMHSMPIYWGNPHVNRDFNTKSFLYWDDFGSDEALIERIIELDKDDDKYAEVYNEPYLHNNELNKWMYPDRVLRFFMNIFENPFTRRKYYYSRTMYNKMIQLRIKGGAIKRDIQSFLRLNR